MRKHIDLDDPFYWYEVLPTENISAFLLDLEDSKKAALAELKDYNQILDHIEHNIDFLMERHGDYCRINHENTKSYIKQLHKEIGVMDLISVFLNSKNQSLHD